MKRHGSVLAAAVVLANSLTHEVSPVTVRQ
jgi:hypothetical protein